MTGGTTSGDRRGMRTLARGNHRLVAGALAAVLALGFIGCGDDDDSAADNPDTSSTIGSGTVEVTAVDYGYENLPSEVAAGSRLTLTNASDTEVHELVAVRLPDDEERSADDLVKLPQEQLEAVLGGGEPAAVLIAPPAADGFPAVGDGALTESGRYLIFCSIPTGADPAAFLAAAQAAAEAQSGPPQVPGGPPHFVQGMYAELDVVQ